MRKLAISFVTLTSLTACSQGDELASQWSFELPDNMENDEQFARFGEPLASPGYDRLASAEPMVEEDMMPGFSPSDSSAETLDLEAGDTARDLDAELEIEFDALEDALAGDVTSLNSDVQSSTFSSSDPSLEELMELNFPSRGPRPDPLAYVRISAPRPGINRAVSIRPVHRPNVAAPREAIAHTPSPREGSASLTSQAIDQSQMSYLSPIAVPDLTPTFTTGQPDAIQLSLQAESSHQVPSAATNVPQDIQPQLYEAVLNVGPTLDPPAAQSDPRDTALINRLIDPKGTELSPALETGVTVDLLPGSTMEDAREKASDSEF